MKPKTFLLATLFLPYLCWIIGAPFYNTSIAQSNDYPFILRALASLLNLYVISIRIWGIPYTFLVIGLLIWSKNKSAYIIYKTVFYSPLLLTALTAVEFTILAFYMEILTLVSGTQSSSDTFDTLGILFFPVLLSSLLAAMVITPFGYFFVSIGIASYKLLERLEVIKSEGEIMPTILSMATKSWNDNYLTGL